MLDGVIITRPQQFPDERGTVKHFITENDPQFQHFGEVYMTTVYKDVIKGFHGYVSKTLHYVVPIGNIKLVMYDNRSASSTYQDFEEVFLGQENYIRLTIPPGVFSAFRGMSNPYSLAVICADEVFDENKTLRIPIKDLPYDWSIKNR